MKTTRRLRKKVAKLKTQKFALLRELFFLQKFGNEIVAKYDALRTGKEKA